MASDDPDRLALAKASGFHAERIDVTDEFVAAFERALASESGVRLDLNVSPATITPRRTLGPVREAAMQAVQAK